MHPEIAKTLVAQRHEQLTRHTAESRQTHDAGSGWLSRYLPRWHVTWTRTVLSSAEGRGTAVGGRSDRSGKRGSSVVIIISAHR
jgi:hypothetical protein